MVVVAVAPESIMRWNQKQVGVVTPQRVRSIEAVGGDVG